MQLNAGSDWSNRLELKQLIRAEYHIMSQTVDVSAEPLKWPIAPDGYIPNSVIRSWGRKETELERSEIDCWHDIIFHSLHQEDERTNDQSDLSTRTFWLIESDEEEEEEEEETTDSVKRKTKEKEDDKKQKHREEKKVEGKERADEEKEKEDKMDRTVLVKWSYNIQTKTTLQDHLKTFDDENTTVTPQRQELDSSYFQESSRKTVDFTPISCHENGLKQPREPREDISLHESVTEPHQYLPVPNKQRTSSFVCKEWSEPPVESLVVSADTIIPKQGPRVTSYIPSVEIKTLTPPPSPSSEEPQPQPDLGPPKCSPIRDKRFLLSSTKYNNIRDQAPVPLDQKVLKLYKKIKVTNMNSSHLRNLATTAERSPASMATRSNVQTNSAGLNLNLGSPDCSAQLAQTILPIKDQRGHESIPEWRKSLYRVISLQGFCSSRGARLATADHLAGSSNARQLAATIPPLQPGKAEGHQRVVQKIQMKDTLELDPLEFHYVIPMASQHSFFPLIPCGKTLYGRLQFDWMRGSEEEKLLEVSTVMTKDPAHEL
ncbi:apoptotic chromatin condensation inducer in the nucleus-like isoform X2 [Micropterus dolomieu]|uniref:apoptotic chromatin condensation inducer in the nucleus-like isoform X2 n=1 Tax=Micropterus dolomieu TaxID=147949 RepID=UPI001E8D4F70|nr:apoptotic chromatin condensation inducer in the nucleus-like isoform X2 [Micropterus dolomieu]